MRFKHIAISLLMLMVYSTLIGCVAMTPTGADSSAEEKVTNTPSEKTSSVACHVPDVEGLDQTAAQQAIQIAGLSALKEFDYSETVSADLVFKQSPTPGTRWDPCEGEVVMLISLGAPPPVAASVDSETTEQAVFDVVLIAAGDAKIDVIKAVRNLREDLGLKEAKELVDSAPTLVLEGVSKEVADKASDLLESAGATVEIESAKKIHGESEPPVESETSPSDRRAVYDVLLTKVGHSKIQVIKAVRNLREDLGLKGAKELVESAPTPVLEGVSKEEADKALDLLESAGARVDIESAHASEAGEDVSSSSKDEFQDVILVEVGPERTQVIKILRSIISNDDLSRIAEISDAIALVSTVPSIVLHGVDTRSADLAREELEGAGATVELQATSDSPIETPPPTDKPFLMPIEDVFSIRGRGIAVTGRIDRGSIKPMDEVEIVGLRETRKTVATALEMFHKSLDSAQAGDNVGVLLRGIDRDEIERGMVLAEPESIQAHTSFEADIYILTKDEGGRHKPFFEGYRPQFYIGTIDVTGTVHLPEGIEMVTPGDVTTAKVELMIPVAMEQGMPFAIREGGLTVGIGWVNETLD